MPLGFDNYCRADRVAITFLPAKTEYDRLADVLHRVAQNSQLRRAPVFQYDFQSSILVQVGKRECSAVFKKVQSHCAGDFRKCSVAIICVKNIPLPPAPGVV